MIARAKSYTPRGFGVYEEFEDSYGNRVRVQESSRAVMEGEDGPYLWVFCQNPTKTRVVDRIGTKQAQDESLHLTPTQARRLRKALNAWLREVR